VIKSNKSLGLVPVDILLIGAINAGIADLRKKPYLLDFLFNWFSQDDLTSKFFGDQEKQRAKDWFLQNKIDCTLAIRQDLPKFPLISVNLTSSNEDMATMGDVDPDISEDIDMTEANVTPVKVLGPFTPQAYDSTTGIVTLPDGFTTTLVFENQLLVDSKNSIGYTILKVIDDSTFAIDTDINANFQNAYVASADTTTSVSLESCFFRQSYSIKCFAQNEPLYVSYLTMIVNFIMLRYKEVYLEARGFQGTVISGGPIYWAEQLTGVENSFGSDVNVSGLVRVGWPKAFAGRIDGIKLHGINVLDGGTSPDSVDFETQGWGLSPGDIWPLE
jgi:hypothetical protein